MRVTISGEDVKDLVRTATRGRWAASTNRYLGAWDGKLYMPTVAELRAVSVKVYELFAELEEEERAESFDCEDYAFAFTGMVRAFAAQELGRRNSIAIGMALGQFQWSGDERHACNWCVIRARENDSAPSFAWLEPQVNPASGANWFHDVGEARALEIMII